MDNGELSKLYNLCLKLDIETPAELKNICLERYTNFTEDKDRQNILLRKYCRRYDYEYCKIDRDDYLSDMYIAFENSINCYINSNKTETVEDMEKKEEEKQRKRRKKQKTSRRKTKKKIHNKSDYNTIIRKDGRIVRQEKDTESVKLIKVKYATYLKGVEDKATSDYVRKCMRKEISENECGSLYLIDNRDYCSLSPEELKTAYDNVKHRLTFEEKVFVKVYIRLIVEEIKTIPNIKIAKVLKISEEKARYMRMSIFEKIQNEIKNG